MILHGYVAQMVEEILSMVRSIPSPTVDPDEWAASVGVASSNTGELIGIATDIALLSLLLILVGIGMGVAYAYYEERDGE